MTIDTTVKIKHTMFELFLLTVGFPDFVLLCQQGNGFCSLRLLSKGSFHCFVFLISFCGYYSRAASIQANTVFSFKYVTEKCFVHVFQNVFEVKIMYCKSINNNHNFKGCWENFFKLSVMNII